MRFARLIMSDIRYQYKYGFYFLYGIITVVYIGMLAMLPGVMLRSGTALIILTDPAALGYFFIGGMILLEKGEGLHSYFSILPVTAGEYVLAKALSLSLISTLTGIIIAAFTLGSQVNYLVLSTGLFTGAAVFTLLGLTVGTMANSVNHYFVISAPTGLILMSPAFLTVFGITHPVIEILPATLLLHLLYGAVGLELPYNILFVLTGLLVWLFPVFWLAKGRFSLYLQQGRG